MRIVVHKMDSGDGRGHRWFGWVYNGSRPIVASATASDVEPGHFRTKREALAWSRKAKASILDELISGR